MTVQRTPIAEVIGDAARRRAAEVRTTDEQRQVAITEAHRRLATVLRSPFWTNSD